MKGWLLLIISLLILIGLAIAFFLVPKLIEKELNKTESETQGGLGGQLEEIFEKEGQRSAQEHTIEITSKFSPKTLTINKGDKVVFRNTVSTIVWPASAVHPTHTVYPGSGISKCTTSEKDQIFDACKGLKEGEAYNFTFNETGTWGYHDHLSTSRKGTIIVN